MSFSFLRIVVRCFFFALYMHICSFLCYFPFSIHFYIRNHILNLQLKNRIISRSIKWFLFYIYTHITYNLLLGYAKVFFCLLVLHSSLSKNVFLLLLVLIIWNHSHRGHPSILLASHICATFTLFPAILKELLSIHFLIWRHNWRMSLCL